MNPIVRMMKRYIKMPLKYALPLLFIGALVLASTTGCTESTTSSNGGGGANVIDTINSAYTKANYTVVTSFTTSVNGNGNTVYKGVVDDGPNVLQPYRNNVTIVMAPNRTAAMKEYNASIAQAQSKGYNKNIMDQKTSWFATSSSTMTYPNQQVKITIREPSIIGVNPYGTDVYLSIDSNKYGVCTVYQSPAP
jgi:hypothetical protein